MNREVGRQLLAHELKVGTVVCVGRVDRPTALTTLRVEQVTENLVLFLGAAIIPRHSLMLRRSHDSRMFDEMNREFQAFEYLGEV